MVITTRFRKEHRGVKFKVMLTHFDSIVQYNRRRHIIGGRLREHFRRVGRFIHYKSIHAEVPIINSSQRKEKNVWRVLVLLFIRERLY